MPRHANYVPKGVIPAVLLPFENDLSIDETSFRKHLRDVASVEGLSAITINAHSTEVGSCSFDEQKRVLDIAQDEIGARLPLVNGIWADGSIEAARLARMAEQGGASALLVFPPAPFALGPRPGRRGCPHVNQTSGPQERPLRIALLTYRGKTTVGGQGVYVRHLAKALVDLGHHAQGVNIEQIVALLDAEGRLGGFHFNNRKYADDDLIVGSVNPWELFLIFFELAEGVAGEAVCTGLEELGGTQEAADVVSAVLGGHGSPPSGRCPPILCGGARGDATPGPGPGGRAQ